MISQAHAGMGFYFDDDNTSFSISSGRGHYYAPPPPPPPREFGPGPCDGPRGFAHPPRGPQGHHHRHFR